MTKAKSLGERLLANDLGWEKNGPLREHHVVPPFTVLDARVRDWRVRKAAWLSLGIESEIGRAEGLLSNRLGLTSMERIDGHARAARGTSVFDPVLCEIMYRWFCPFDGMVLDPFAGGSVRGLMAGALGYRYYGVDLRGGQIEANRAQKETMMPGAPVAWVVGDSMDELALAPGADFVFSCPPYGDTEKYSEDPRDLSNMEWGTFAVAYAAIIQKAIGKLKPNRFATFLVGEIRDPKTGLYRGFVPLTVAACAAGGAALYNEAVLLTMGAAAAIRAPKMFGASRKLCKTHQDVLVFVKGDPRLATAAIEVAAPPHEITSPKVESRTEMTKDEMEAEMILGESE